MSSRYVVNTKTFIMNVIISCSLTGCLTLKSMSTYGCKQITYLPTTQMLLYGFYKALERLLG